MKVCPLFPKVLPSCAHSPVHEKGHGTASNTREVMHSSVFPKELPLALLDSSSLEIHAYIQDCRVLPNSPLNGAIVTFKTEW